MKKRSHTRGRRRDARARVQCAGAVRKLADPTSRYAPRRLHRASLEDAALSARAIGPNDPISPLGIEAPEQRVLEIHERDGAIVDLTNPAEGQIEQVWRSVL